jgi:protein ImuB
LYEIPRASLQRRFLTAKAGEAVLKRLDQARGVLKEPLEPRLANPPLRFLASPAEPYLTHEEIGCVFDDLLQTLFRDLEKSQQGALHVTLRGFHGNGTVNEITVRLAQPSRDLTHMRNLFVPKLNELDPGFGIDAFILTAERVEALQAQQYALDGDHDDRLRQEEAFGQLVDRISNHLGSGQISGDANGSQVYQVSENATHLPERISQAIAPLSTPPMPKHGTALAKAQFSTVRPFRPLTLFDQPEMIDVVAEIPHGPPLTFRWRRLVRRVTKARGPERILPEWWLDMTNSERVRDYYEVEDQTGQRYWLYREGLYGDPTHKGGPLWRVHGLFA